MKTFITNLIITICGVILCLLAVKTGQYALAVVGAVVSSIKVTFWD